jgi:hypothetical protein
MIAEVVVFLSAASTAHSPALLAFGGAESQPEDRYLRPGAKTAVEVLRIFPFNIQAAR